MVSTASLLVYTTLLTGKQLPKSLEKCASAVNRVQQCKSTLPDHEDGGSTLLHTARICSPVNTQHTSEDLVLQINVKVVYETGQEIINFLQKTQCLNLTTFIASSVRHTFLKLLSLVHLHSLTEPSHY